MTEGGPKHLFVYGTLRLRSEHPMARALSAEAGFVGVGRVPGQLHDLGAYPGGVPDVHTACRIVGDVYRLHRPEPTLSRLDRYEGCGPDDPEPHDFRRVRVRVELAAGRSLDAWMYRYDGPLEGARPIPSGDWMEPDRLARPRVDGPR